jgi:hypothetical protein
MSRDNPTWGAPGILSELLLLGHDVAEGTAAKTVTSRVLHVFIVLRHDRRQVVQFNVTASPCSSQTYAWLEKRDWS